MPSQQFVYVIYISATPERVWSALLEGELTRRYWQRENVSDWTPGSQWEHVSADADRTLKVAGTVQEIVPNKRLVLTWGEPNGADAVAPPSRVTIEIEPVEDMVRVTVIHDDLESGSDMLQRVTNGWPRVLSSLKSFLETGRPLNTWA